MLNTQLDLSGDTKLKELYIGPYQLLEFITPVNVILKDCKTGRKIPRSIHINKIKKYISSKDIDTKSDGRNLHLENVPSTPTSTCDNIPDMTTNLDTTAPDTDVEDSTPYLEDSTEVQDADTNSDESSPITSDAHQPGTPTKKDITVYPIETIYYFRTNPCGIREYYVKFAGYGKKHNQWISELDMSPTLRERVTKRKLKKVTYKQAN